jgi:3-hydroxyacyl-[acyl-carrier-protein] dehydratase
MDEARQGAPTADLDIIRIMELIPHRYPFLMIERLTEIVPHESAVGIKNVSINEPHFQGHFPARPIMPGMLIIEAMAQTAACLVMHSLDLTRQGRLVYFMSVDEARFRKPVVPGDTLKVHVQKQRRRGNVWRFAGEARVEGTLVAEAVYTAMIADEQAKD